MLKATWASHSLAERALAYNNIRLTGDIAVLGVMLFFHLTLPTTNSILALIVTSLDIAVLWWQRVMTLKEKPEISMGISLVTASIIATIGLHMGGGFASLSFGIYLVLILVTALVFHKKTAARVMAIIICCLFFSLTAIELANIISPTREILLDVYNFSEEGRLLTCNMLIGLILILLTMSASGGAAEMLGNWSRLLSEKVAEKTAQYNDLLNEIEESYSDIVSTLANAIEAKDNYIEEHSERIKEWAIKTAITLECDEHFINRLGFSAMLHDIGKIGIPDYILNKKGQLTSEEHIKMQEHTIIGEKILCNIEKFQDVAKFVRAHHERFDGRGYPDGLSGEEIPFVSRIISVVDAYVTITDERIYRAARSPAEAIQILIHESGKQFDPNVVEAFLYTLQKEFFAETKIIPYVLTRFTERKLID